MGGDDTEAAWCRAEKGAMPPKSHWPSHHRQSCWLIFALLIICVSLKTNPKIITFPSKVWLCWLIIVIRIVWVSLRKSQNPHTTIKGVAVFADLCHPDCLRSSQLGLWSSLLQRDHRAASLTQAYDRRRHARGIMLDWEYEWFFPRCLGLYLFFTCMSCYLTRIWRYKLSSLNIMYYPAIFFFGG